ncbi:tyrosine-type recombinase/integrase [Arthrobacter cryoconiti]|uniref:Tyrosine-type recombinase/integrase n=1 Tax=Arthrobacter cryoconiti TaxID=748907 RepID=A0ABV8QW67_9MICC|nr:site-specific integrase [Arthrobacter cryoconiti]MCC9069769.1 site-specific integrase [Arthrobacter cryoconiti]
MASIRRRVKKDGSPSFTVRWRDPVTRVEQGLSFGTEIEATVLERLLDANGQSFTISQDAVKAQRQKTRTVTDVVKEHLEHLVRPSSGTIRTYQPMLEHHIAPLIGTIAVADLDERHLTHWVRAMQAKGSSPKTIHNVHGLIFSAIEFAIRAGYRPDNPCRGMRLPVGETIGDDAQFLTPDEFAVLPDKIPLGYKVFVQFLVMTGTRFGEANTVTIDDLELPSHPATVQITKSWKRDGNNAYYVGPTKSRAGRRTVSLPPVQVEQLTLLIAGRGGSELVFVSESSGRIVHSTFWQKTWVPSVTAAHDAGLAKTPRIHDLRHTHASWLMQDRVSLFTISGRLGHASTRTTESIYGHLMPQALQDAADAVQRSATLWKQ